MGRIRCANPEWGLVASLRVAARPCGNHEEPTAFREARTCFRLHWLRQTRILVVVDPAIEEAGDIDTALISFQDDNGALGSIDNSRKAAFGTNGMAEAYNDYPNDTIMSDTNSIEPHTQSYVDELKAFVSAIVDDTEPLVTGLDGRAPVVIGKAALRSIQERRTVLLPEYE